MRADAHRRLTLGELADAYGELAAQGVLPDAWCRYDLRRISAKKSGREVGSALSCQVAWRYRSAHDAMQHVRGRADFLLTRALHGLLARWADPAEITETVGRINAEHHHALTEAELKALVEHEVAVFNRRNRAGQRRMRA
jgi:Ser-tRNA(Ala) deacylase AlaX